MSYISIYTKRIIFAFLSGFIASTIIIITANAQAARLPTPMLLGIGGQDPIYVPDNYPSIQEAVNKALPEDTIIVKKGSYTENVLVNKTLTIKSEKGAKATKIQAAIPTKPVFNIRNTAGVGIIGFTVTGSDYAGIYLYHSDKGKILRNKVLHNKNGIYLNYSSNNTLIKNTANSNSLGISFYSSHSNTLKNNKANSNKDKGIVINSSNYNVLVNNTVNLNGWNGIILWSSHNNRLTGNKVLKNRFGIVLSNSENNTLANNSTRQNIYLILPIVLIYLAVFFYFVERKIFYFMSEKWGW